MSDRQNTDMNRAAEIFERASQLEHAERGAYLTRTCAGDSKLRAEIESMLAARSGQGEFFDEPTLLGKLEDDSTAPPHGPGRVIGRYKLLQRIGEGGFGVVYMAEQEQPMRRRVALKVIKLGMDTKQVIARFEAERQALALMEHPNIARVLDAGATETGRPYFVMELVKGVPITEYCDANRLSTRGRLDLFVAVCSAVQHAHQKGVVHRDIKPSNVMVTMHDGDPVPKVIDFGIAKATHQRLTEKTLFTEYGQFIGTPVYMSPEQAEMSGLDIDTRSDIYSLGVLLYELLTGTTPLDLKTLREAGYGEIQRIIREEEPPTPSTRLGTLGDALTNIAKHRQSEPSALTRLIRGDLDWIVMKALEKNRTRRYDSASEFAADIARHFDNEPVLARSPSAAYRVRKFVRKHRGPVAAAAAIGATIVLLGSVSFWQGLRAQHQATRVRAHSILASAAAAEDPLLKALLIEEIAEVPHVNGRLGVALEAANSPLPAVVLRGHEGEVVSAAFSPDGTRVITASNDWTVRIWSIDGTKQPVVLKHEGRIRGVAFAPDGTRVATVSTGGVARIWRPDGTGEPIVLRGHELTEGRIDVWSVVFSPDGSRVVTAGGDGTARVWQADGTGEPVVLRGHGDAVYNAVFSPDGTRVGTASRDGTARIWKMDGTGDPIVLKHEDRVRRIAFSPDGSLVLTASDDRTGRIWSVDGAGDPVVLRGHEHGVRFAAFSPDGTRVITASNDWTARVWRTDGIGDPIVLRGHEEPVITARFSPDGAYVVTTSADWTARLWRSDRKGEPIAVFRHEGWVDDAAFSPDGTWLVTASEDHTVRIWRSGKSREAFVFRGHDDDIVSITFSSDGDRALTGSKDGTAQVWRIDGIGDPVVLGPHGAAIMDAVFSPDDTRIVTAARDGVARVWRADGTGEPVVLQGHEAVLCDADFSPDGNRIVTASWDGTARIWPTDGVGNPVILRHEDSVAGAAFHPDGTRVVTTSADGTARIWRADGTGEPVALPGAKIAFASFCVGPEFSPDGTRVVSGHVDGTVNVWHTDGTGEPVVLQGHKNLVTSTAFSPDGTRVVTASGDGTARVWQADGMGESIVFREHTGELFYAAFNHDGTRVVSASIDGTARVWSADGTGETIVLRDHAVWRAVFTPDGTRVVTLPDGGAARVWPVTWPALREYLRANVNACLTPEQRMKFLAERESEAWDTYTACERGYGREPEAGGHQ